MTSSETAPSPGVAGTRLAPVGGDWDVIQVGRFYGLQALQRLAAPGSVTVDGAVTAPTLSFFVPPGTAGVWRAPQTIALGPATHVSLPPDGKEAPPGLWWLIPPRDGEITLTSADALRLALEISFGPQPGAQAS